MNEKFGRRDAYMDKNKNQYWTVGKVKRILDNEVYTGTMVAGKVKSASVGSKKKIAIDEEEWIRVADAHESIVSKELFEKTLELRASGFYHGIAKNESHILCGKVFCSSCGKSMSHSHQGIPKFLCHNKYYFATAKGFDDVDCVDSIHDKVLEALVVGAIETTAIRAADIVRIRKKSNHELLVKRKDLEKEVNKITANINGSDEVLMKKYEEYLERKISREEYQDLRAQIETENEKNQDQIQQLQEQIDSDIGLQTKKITGLELLANCIKVEKLTQELVNTLVDKVVVKKGKAVEVKLKVKA
ncbi:MAG: recombinase family protein [Lachnotalea sp.]